jgi:hypothetical protein
MKTLKFPPPVPVARGGQFTYYNSKQRQCKYNNLIVNIKLFPVNTWMLFTAIKSIPVLEESLDGVGGAGTASYHVAQPLVINLDFRF